ncbi:hypothetical protein D3C72_2395270 [compost metagenome]
MQLRFELQALAVVARYPDQVFVVVEPNQLGADFRGLFAAVATAHLLLKDGRQLVLLGLADALQPVAVTRQ